MDGEKEGKELEHQKVLMDFYMHWKHFGFCVSKQLVLNRVNSNSKRIPLGCASCNRIPVDRGATKGC